MNVSEFQIAAAALAAIAWPDEKNDPGRLDAELGDKLAEEIGELAKVCRRHGFLRTHWRNAPQVSDEEVLDEVGDVLFVLARRAALHGIDLAAAGERALGKFHARLLRLGHAEADVAAALGTPATVEASQAGGQPPDVVPVPREVYDVVLKRLDYIANCIHPSGPTHDIVVRDHERLKMCAPTTERE